MSLLFPLITIVLVSLGLFCMFMAVRHNRNMQLMFEQRRTLSASSLPGRGASVESNSLKSV